MEDFSDDDKVYQLPDTKVIYRNMDKYDSDKFIVRKHNGDIHLRKFTNINSSARACVVTLEGKFINFEMMYYMLKCAEVEDDKKYYKNTITSVRWKNKNKGVSMKWFKYSLGLGVTNENSNISAKLTKKSKLSGDKYKDSHKIQISGYKDTEEATDIANFIIGEVEAARRTYNYIKQNKQLFYDCSLWISENSNGETVEVDSRDVYRTKNTVVRITKTDTVYSINWPMYNKVPKDYREMYVTIYNICSDIIYTNQIVKRSEKILEMIEEGKSSIPCERGITLVDTRVSMVNANYRIGSKINREKLTTYLFSRGFCACYFNEFKPYIQVKMDNEANAEECYRRENKLQNTFFIYEKGTIRHSGTGGIFMMKNYVALMLSIIEYAIERDEVDKMFALA